MSTSVAATTNEQYKRTREENEDFYATLTVDTRIKVP
jgi:hypothetical protein